MGSGNFGGFKNTKGSLKPEHLMEELRNSGIKFTEEDIVMIAKQKNGELLWLERGNKVAGLIHIEEGHSENLKSAFGVNKNSIPSFIKNVIEQGEIVSNVKKGKKITRIYDFGGKHYVLCALGTNGFIVSVYPR